MGFFRGTRERVRGSRGGRAVGVRAAEVLLYLFINDQSDLNFHCCPVSTQFQGNFRMNIALWRTGGAEPEQIGLWSSLVRIRCTRPGMLFLRCIH